MSTTLTAPTSPTPLIPAEQVAQYHDEGYMILERVIPEEMLQMLREECSYFMGYEDCRMDLERKKVEGLTHRSKRYFISNQYRRSQRLWKFIYSDVMAQIAMAALGPDVYLFHEQWVVKGADKGMKFAWHQDSGYVKFGDRMAAHKPYLTCWCTLDDVSVANGTVYLLPHSRGGTKDFIYDHTKEEGTNDLIGYTGSDPGIPVIVPAGSVVAFTSYNFHCSGANTTPNMRRIYLPQYSGEVLRNSKGERWAQAVPFCKDGKNIYNRATDDAAQYGGAPWVE